MSCIITGAYRGDYRCTMMSYVLAHGYLYLVLNLLYTSADPLDNPIAVYL
jgi:hypothetical protein